MQCRRIDNLEESTMGARILRRRKEKGLTQEALANKLGVSNQAVSKWEGDVCCPDLQLLPLLADTLELSLDELFGRESMAKAAQKRKRTARSCPSRQSCRGRMTTPSTPCSSRGTGCSSRNRGACSATTNTTRSARPSSCTFPARRRIFTAIFRRLHRFDDLRQRQSR